MSTPSLVQLELPVELLGDLSAEEVPLEAVGVDRVLVLVVEPNRLEECLSQGQPPIVQNPALRYNAQWLGDAATSGCWHSIWSRDRDKS